MRTYRKNCNNNIFNYDRDNIPIHITNTDICEALLPIERVVMIVFFTKNNNFCCRKQCLRNDSLKVE